MEIILIALVLGLLPAIIAHSKGRSFLGWWVYGFLLFIIAIVHSIVIKKDPKTIEQEAISNGMKACPFCAEMVKNEAIKCKHCGSDISEIKSSAPEKTDEEYLEDARRKAGLID